MSINENKDVKFTTDMKGMETVMVRAVQKCIRITDLPSEINLGQARELREMLGQAIDVLDPGNYR